LRASLDIPVFHDDQHGTAVVVLAAFLNALRVVDKKVEEVKVVLTGVGAAGVAVTGTLRAAGVRRIIGCDRQGAIYRGRPGLEGVKARYAEETNPENERGSADDLLDANCPSARSRARSRRPASGGWQAVVFAMANPTPEVAPEDRGLRDGDRDGRSDYPNQINNVLAFPGSSRRARRARLDDHGGDGSRSRPRNRGDDFRG
jgi:malate dehydrogenase (oxaloacetate-decarboxylating)